MKALSLWQPWATLIALGAKKIETRSWKTDYRGPLAIHAAKNDSGKLYAAYAPFHSVLRAAGYYGWHSLPRGVVVATCQLLDCVSIRLDSSGWQAAFNLGTWELTDQERAFGDYTPGRYAWLLADVKPLPTPIPMRGAQGLFELPGELVTP